MTQDYISVLGTDNSDIIRGTSESNFMNGRDGNDILYGLEGNDMLVGADGADRFAYSALPSSGHHPAHLKVMPIIKALTLLPTSRGRMVTA